MRLNCFDIFIKLFGYFDKQVHWYYTDADNQARKVKDYKKIIIENLILLILKFLRFYFTKFCTLNFLFNNLYFLLLIYLSSLNSKVK